MVALGEFDVRLAGQLFGSTIPSESFSMKKFHIKSTAIAASFVCSGVVFAAGLITATVPSQKFAAEALAAAGTTVLSTASVNYRMGIAVASGTTFWIKMAPSSGATINAGTACSTLPLINLPAGLAGTASATIAPGVGDATGCTWSVAAKDNFAASTTSFYVVPSFASHGLATVGGTVGITLNITDVNGQQLDNSLPLAATVGTSVQAISLAAANDTGTQMDVNYKDSTLASKPLFGFLAGNDDTATVAKAQFSINTNIAAYNPGGAASYNYGGETNNGVVMTVVGDYSGLGTPVVRKGGTAVTGATVTVNAAKTSATFTIAASNISNAGAGTNDFTLELPTTASQSLGTSRVFQISGTASPQTGAAVTLSPNSTWWTWSANAIQLLTPTFSLDPAASNISRFIFTNSGSAASYTSSCFASTGATVTPGAASGGTLITGQTILKASDICTISTGMNAGVTFTINAPAGGIKGVYEKIINGQSSAYLPLVRPYGATVSGTGITANPSVE